MNAWTISPSIRIAFVCLAAGIVALGGMGWAACVVGAEDPAQDKGTIFRYDPLHHLRGAPDRGPLVPISEQEARPGAVYSHFDARLNRRVWAIYQGDGKFWHALGGDTAQPAPALDVRMPKIGEETWTNEASWVNLVKADRDLLRDLAREPGWVYFSLDKNGSWQLNRDARHATVYDVETQYHWEWSAGQYVRTSSAPFAYRWRFVDGRYVPVPAPAFDVDCVFPVPPNGALHPRGCPCE